MSVFLKLSFSIMCLFFLPNNIVFGNVGQRLAEKLFLSVTSNDDTQTIEILSGLAKIDASELSLELNTDKEKFAFWINIYNSHILFFLKKNPEWYLNRNLFFKKKLIVIAGEQLSFDLIEHGILRKSAIKYSLGYLNKWCVSKFEKQFRVKNNDPRLHFALNCGAKSCPIIKLYNSETLDLELDKNTRYYLSLNVELGKDYISLPLLFSWFRADFGGKKGIRSFLEKYEITSKNDCKKKIIFSDYDWTLELN